METRCPIGLWEPFQRAVTYGVHGPMWTRQRASSVLAPRHDLTRQFFCLEKGRARCNLCIKNPVRQA